MFDLETTRKVKAKSELSATSLTGSSQALTSGASASPGKHWKALEVGPKHVLASVTQPLEQ